MSALSDAVQLFETFKVACQKEPCDTHQCQQLLSQLKLSVFPGLQSVNAWTKQATDSETLKGRTLARDTLELACFLSIESKDVDGFERHVSQLTTYWGEQKSPFKLQIMGLYLLHLLSADKIGDFHKELQLIEPADRESPYIMYPVKLDQYLTEGDYARILEPEKDIPAKYSKFFMDELLNTVRSKIGASLENSYDKLPAKVAAEMLLLKDLGGLGAFANEENERKKQENDTDVIMGDATPSIRNRPCSLPIRWDLNADGYLYFRNDSKKGVDIVQNAMTVIKNTVDYATDLEKII